MAGAFWCVVEDDRQGAPKKVMAEALGEAGRLAGGNVEAVWLTDKATEAGIKQLGEWGATKVWLVENAALAPYRGEVWAPIIAELAGKESPKAILGPVTSRQRELLARVAARLGVGLCADAVALKMDGDKLVGTRPVYAGKLVSRVTWAKGPWVATLRPNVFRPAEAQPGNTAKVEKPSVTIPEAKMAFVERREEAATGLPELTEAEIVISGGRGMKGPENYVILEAMGKVIGAAVGASRAAVDAGWRPHRFQIGQTGRTISPKLYLGFGVSGAIQHLAGMRTSKVIVAVNKDPEAPIFKIADYGIVGDLFEVVPALTEEFKKLLDDMNLDLSAEQRMIRDVARDFAEREVRPIAAEIDRDARFPHETIKRMGELGLMGILAPERWGGAGGDTVAYAVAMEEIARVCGSHAVVMSVNNSLFCDPISKYGSDAQKERFLRPVASGHEIGCFALTEPQAGSDATNQHTLAARDGDHYVVKGRKVFVTSGREASAALVLVQTDQAKGSHGISALLIEKSRAGFLVPKTEEKLGIRASDTAEFVFEDCRVPVANRLGDEGQGFKIAMSSLDGGRIEIAAQALGLAVGAYERALAYARERKSFGVPIGQHQMVQWMLADMAVAIDGARLLIWQAASLKDAGRPFSTQSAMAKLFAADMAMKVTTDAVQIHGGYGFIREYEVERFFRDAKITQIYEGTSQIQKLVIARSVLGGKA